MDVYSLNHVADPTLLQRLTASAARERGVTATFLSEIAEVDARRLYLPAAYPSMHAYCVQKLNLSEDEAYRRIQAARVARRFPAIFHVLAEGRLHLSGVIMLAPHLTEATADELLAAATHKSKAEIEKLLARRFPRPEVAARVIPSSEPAVAADLLAAPSDQLAPERVLFHTAQLAPERVGAPADRVDLDPVGTFAPRGRVTPLSAERYAFTFTGGQELHELYRYAEALMSHEIRPGDMAALFLRALKSLVHEAEKCKFAATARPGRGKRSTEPGERYVPAAVRRAVWERDGGQCTFVSEDGHRCPARTLLEFDHAEEVARGGRATVDGIRLRCRPHNQYTAEQTFGAEFMAHKREAAREAADERRAAKEARAHEAVEARARAAAARAQAAEADEARTRAAEARAQAAEERARREEEARARAAAARAQAAEERARKDEEARVRAAVEERAQEVIP